MSNIDKEERISSLLKSHIDLASTYVDGKIAPDRIKAYDYYYGKLPAPRKNSPSIVRKVVSQKVQELLPQLKDPFLSGRDVVKFIPYNKEDGFNARVASATVNQILKQDNALDSIYTTLILDGLIAKNGIIKAYWDKSEEYQTTSFSNLTMAAVDMLLASNEDEEIALVDDELIENDPEFNLEQILGILTQQFQINIPALYPLGYEVLTKKATDWDKLLKQLPSLKTEISNLRKSGLTYSGVIEREVDTSTVKIVNIQPENFLIDEDAICISDATFVAERRKVSVSELDRMDFSKEKVNKVIDGAASYIDNSNVSIARNQFDDTDTSKYNYSADQSEDDITLYECYIKTSLVEYSEEKSRGKRSKLYQIFYCNGVVLSYEEVDEVPFYSWTPLPVAHKFYGQSLAETLFDEQDTLTAALRGATQYLAFSTNPRYKSVGGAEYNLGAFQANLPGSVVPIAKGDLVPFEYPRLDQGIFQIMSTIESNVENNTGVSKMSTGLDPNALNPSVSATAVSLTMGASERRLKAIAQNLATNAILPCMQYVYELYRKNSEKDLIVTVDGKDVKVNPKSLPQRRNLEIEYSISKTDKVEHANTLLSLKQRIMADPQLQKYHGPEECRNLEIDVLNDMNVWDPERYLVLEAPSGPTPAEQMAAQQADMQHQMAMQQLQIQQAQVQLEQSRVQADAQYKMATMQLEQAKFDHQVRVDADKQSLAEAQLQLDSQIAKDKQILSEQKTEADILSTTAELHLEEVQNRGVAIG